MPKSDEGQKCKPGPGTLKKKMMVMIVNNSNKPFEFKSD